MASPVPQKEPDSPVSQVLSRFRLLRPYSWSLSLGYLLLLITSGFQLLYPGAVAFFIDKSVAGADPAWIVWMAVGMTAILIAHAIASGMRRYLFASVGSRAVADLRNAFFSAVIRQDVEFFDSESVGDLTNRLSVDIDQLQQALTVDAAMLVQTAIIGAGATVMLFVISPPLSLLILVVAPVVVFSMRWVGSRSRVLSRMRQERLAYCGRLANEVFSNIRLVHAFTQENREHRRFDESTRAALGYSLAADRLYAWLEGGATIVQSMALLTTVLVGGALVADKSLSLGQFTSFLLYAGMAAGSAATLGGLWGEWMRVVGATDRVFDLLDQTPRHAPPEADVRANFNGDIHFDAIDFSYPSRPGRNALSGFSLTIRPGEKIALVGASGAGKSTVVNLLLGFYAPDKGEIMIGGRKLTQLGLANVRRQIAIVEQEPALFFDSILENIRYGATAADIGDSQVLTAARNAHVEEFVSGFPDGYQTLVGSRGMQLSGGQKQRVALARALLRDPGLLVLDEATSALDSESEARVQSALQHIMKGRTTIIIAHRLSTIAFADRVVVLRDGKVVQCGSHHELMAAGDGYYQQLVSRQAFALAEAATAGT